MSGQTTFTPVLERALHHALLHLISSDKRPAGATIDLAQLRARFDRPLADAAVDPVRVIDDLVRDAEGGIIGSTS